MPTGLAGSANTMEAVPAVGFRKEPGVDPGAEPTVGHAVSRQTRGGVSGESRSAGRSPVAPRDVAVKLLQLVRAASRTAWGGEWRGWGGVPCAFHVLADLCTAVKQYLLATEWVQEELTARQEVFSVVEESVRAVGVSLDEAVQ